MEILDDEAVKQLIAADLTVRKGRIEKYFKRLAKIVTLLKEFDQRDDFVSSTRLDRTNGAPTTFRVEMPMALKVGTFNGNQAHWQEFRDKFFAQVHEKDHINSVDKMTYLQEGIRQKLRKLGRFLITLKAINYRITDLKSVFKAANYASVAAALKELGIGKRAPSLPLAQYALLNNVGDMLMAACIESAEKNLQTDIKDFLKLLKVKYAFTSNYNTRQKMAKLKRSKKISLPSSSDIAKLQIHNDQKPFRIVKKRIQKKVVVAASRSNTYCCYFI